MTLSDTHWRGSTMPLDAEHLATAGLAAPSGAGMAAGAAPGPGLGEHPPPAAPDGPEGQPRIVQPAIHALLPPALAEAVDADGSGARAEILQLLGQGTTGRVYELQDHSLGRMVAIKCLQSDAAADPHAVASIIDEARLTASLAHPNVLPIYDLDLDDRGCAYFTMRLVEGESLGGIIAASIPERRDPRIGGPAAVVAIFMGVAQALAYAHRLAVIHQDIKPDNIMVGGFGEVLVVDWGCAARLESGKPPRLYGTPLYMSPEQASLQCSDRRSDVYCIGASLFHALLLRPPTWSDSTDEFWRLKRLGVIQAPSAQERRQLPRPILAILMRALEPDPERRYPDAGALLGDLRAWRDGERVEAYREIVIERFVRWHRRHGRRAWLAATAVLTILALLGIVFGERLKEYASWGRPAVVEDFADDGWQSRWVGGVGSFRRVGGALVSDGPTANALFLARACPGATAIEYDAATAADVPPCDIGALWCSDARPAPAGRGLITPTCYAFKFGAFGGGFTIIQREHMDEAGKESQIMPLAYSPQRLLMNRTYHVRAQVADNRLDLWVDGVLVCSWSDPFTFAAGHIGLFAYNSGMTYRHLRVYIRGVALKTPALAVGDAFVQSGDLAGAQEQFARVFASYPDGALGREALFREGLCAYRQGHADEAMALWAPLRGGDHDALIRLEDIDALAEGGHEAEALAAMRSLAPGLDRDLRHRLAIAWGNLVNRLVDQGATRWYEPYLAMHDELFAAEPVVDYTACRLLTTLGRYAEILARYPQQRYYCASALQHLGRFEEVYEQYPDQRYTYDISAFMTGRGESLSISSEPGLVWTSRLHAGKTEEVLRGADVDVNLRSDALIFLDRAPEALAMDGQKPFTRAIAELACGRRDQVKQLSPALDALLAGDEGRVAALAVKEEQFLGGLAADNQLFKAIAADGLAAATRSEPAVGSSLGEYDSWVFHGLLIPLALERLDGRPRLAAILADIRAHHRYDQYQEPWHDASFLAGAIDVAGFRAQPHRLYAEARLLLLGGILADWRGDVTAALVSYRAWTALPFWKRSFCPYAAIEGMVGQRIEVLAGEKPR